MYFLVVVTLAVEGTLLLTLVSVVELVAVTWVSFDAALSITLQLVLVVLAETVGVRVRVGRVVRSVVQRVHFLVVLVGALVLVLGVGFFDQRCAWSLATITVTLVRVVRVLVLVRMISLLVATHGSAHMELVAGSVVIRIRVRTLQVSVRVNHLNAVQSSGN